MSFIPWDWSGSIFWTLSISLLRSPPSPPTPPAVADATRPACSIVAARAAPPASAATRTTITAVFMTSPSVASLEPRILPARERQQRAAAGREQDDEPCRRLPEGKQAERREGERDGERGPDRARPYRVIERRQEQPDHRCVDAGEGRGEARLRPEGRPEGQSADDQEERRQKDRDQREPGAGEAVGARPHHGTEVRGEGEERPRHRLGGAVAGHELLVGHPPGRDDLGLEQRKDDVASAEHQRAGPVKAVEDRERLASHELAAERQPQQRPG